MGFLSHDGNIRVQLGASVSAIRDAIRTGDVNVEADLVDNAITVCVPKLTADEEARLRGILYAATEEYARLRRDRDGTATMKLHRACQQVQADLLRRMSQQGLYAYQDHEILPGGEDLAEPPAPEAAPA